MSDPDPARPARRHRRAVGPRGALPAPPEPRDAPATSEAAASDDERFTADRPPHHDQGV